MFNVFEQPWTLVIAGIVVWFTLLFIHGDSRLWWQSHLIFFLAVACFVLDMLVKAGLFKISITLTITIQAVLCSAIAALFILQIIHIIRTYEQHRWQWILPVVLIVAGFGLDWLVKTDLEKINILISTIRKASEQEDLNAIGALISEDYSDSFHNSKDALMKHCRSLLSKPLIKKSRQLGIKKEISPPRADITLTVKVEFDEQSHYREYQSFVILKIDVDLQKERGRRWFISRAEILEVNRQPVTWGDVR
ncbi:MAG: hypothetical protein GWN67_05600 [Phycisphaerae bacterium]|nr:hypothetical protein [Phycisphaerae bacterium]NIP51433.1 hypothetical protein [Phycisphaerae bacterium]NIS50637.1 hypothetical protein [Phycisphaerae bacterium]NIU08370.1 hypothetical protein [Phycisphaerae bacterium]NIU55869.1 hypothetical protein [Phycisphaerae bacterium]